MAANLTYFGTFSAEFHYKHVVFKIIFAATAFYYHHLSISGGILMFFIGKIRFKNFSLKSNMAAGCDVIL